MEGGAQQRRLRWAETERAGVVPQVTAEYRFNTDTEDPIRIVRQEVGWDIFGEEHMDVLQKMVGDGLARVSMGCDMGDKDFGNGFNASVFVTLTCNQDTNTLIEARHAAGGLAIEFCETHFDAAKEMFFRMRERR